MPIFFLGRCLKCPSYRQCFHPLYRPLFYRVRPCKLPKQKPSHALYYDLIRVPHGHIPAPKANLWSHFPMPIKEYRDYDYYHCPECGDPSFFKIESMCRNCEDMVEYDLPRKAYVHVWNNVRRRARRKYFKNLQKRIEYLILPFLVLIGRAWYVRSVRHHFEDYS